MDTPEQFIERMKTARFELVSGEHPHVFVAGEQVQIADSQNGITAFKVLPSRMMIERNEDNTIKALHVSYEHKDIYDPPF